MPDDAKEKSKSAPEPATAAAAPAKSSSAKTIVVVLVMLVVEAAAIVGAVMFLGKPSDVKAVELEEAKHAEEEKLVEIPVLTEQFMNTSSGRTWIWNTEVVAVVKKRHAGEAPAAAGAAGGGHGGGDHGGGEASDHGHEAHASTVREDLEQRKAQIRTGIGAIFSAAQHNYFTEPGRETLSRQMLEYLRRVFGQDETGEERVQNVLIPKCLGSPLDY
ncbi:MAG TPA: hypothetical protein VG797_00060 [Phycisphaerales bacterium]|nr:hypothetical protein [Phycisphaerales bacterium]